MGTFVCRRGNGNKGSGFTPTFYTKQQTKAVLKTIGVNIVTETEEVFICYCPFHTNTYTPSFQVHKTRGGLCSCFNDSCGYTGNLFTLVTDLTHRTYWEAARFIEKRGSETSAQALDETLKEQATPFTFEQWDLEALQKMHKQMWELPEGRAYLHKRGYTDETIRNFEVGYSKNKKMVAVPLHSPDGMVVGVVGRNIETKAFQLSRGFPRNHTLFNLHKAKKLGSIVIVTEASFDAMKVSQEGFPNVVATLGGSMSETNITLLDRHFDTIILMTDFDDKESHKMKKCKRCTGPCEGHNPGRDLGEAIAGALHHKNILWAVYDKHNIYPGVKDAGDMDGDQIRQCIRNSMSNFEYHERFAHML